MGKKWIWLLVLTAVVGYFFYDFDLLPERVAVHFDAFGNPNGFQTKSQYQATFLGFILVVNGLFGLLSLLISKIPAQTLNVPHKEYWLSKPELKEEFSRKIQGIPPIIGIFTNAVFLLVEHIIYQANIPDSVMKIPVTGSVVLLLLGAGFMVLFLFNVFAPPKGG
jgi:uncharacterized membrane protein